MSVLRTQETEKSSEKKLGKKKKPKKKERLEEEAEEEGGEEVEGGWEKVKGGAPMVKVNRGHDEMFLNLFSIMIAAEIRWNNRSSMFGFATMTYNVYLARFHCKSTTLISEYLNFFLVNALTLKLKLKFFFSKYYCPSPL